MMESNVDEIPAANLHGKITESYVSLVWLGRLSDLLTICGQ